MYIIFFMSSVSSDALSRPLQGPGSYWEGNIRIEKETSAGRPRFYLLITRHRKKEPNQLVSRAYVYKYEFASFKASMCCNYFYNDKY